MRNSFEQPGRHPEHHTGEKHLEKLWQLLGAIGTQYRNEGVPIDTATCRIDMERFRDALGQRVSADIQRVATLENQSKGEAGLSQLEGEAYERAKLSDKIGEQLEVITTVVLNKYLRDRFIVVRASPYDDWVNGVDNVLVDRASGNAVCAFDEVSDLKDDIFIQKQERVLGKNREGGVDLDYGFTVAQEHVVPASLRNLPLFYLALSPKLVRLGVESIHPSLEQHSTFEDQIFSYFTSLLTAEASKLKLELGAEQTGRPELSKHQRIVELIERLSTFDQALATMAGRRVNN